VSEQELVQNILTKHFMDAKSRNKDYSMRAFSKKLNIPPSAISEILRGKRRVSKKLAIKIAERLNLSPDLFDEISKKFNLAQISVTNLPSNRPQMIIDLDYYHMVSDWSYFGVLSLIETTDFKEDFEWISKRLNLTTHKVKTILKKLEETGFLIRDESGKLKPFDKNINTSDDVKNLSIKKRHEQNMDDAKAHLYDTPVDKREFGCLTMAMDSSKINEVKEMIRDFQNKLSTYLEEGTKNEVYELSIQLFPRTNILQNNNNEGEKNEI